MTTNPITHTDEAALLDDHAVDLFAKAMKDKLGIKRQQGFGGWHDIRQTSSMRLADLLLAAVAKGDPVDVANFAMMLFCRNESHEALKQSCAKFCGGHLSAVQQQPAPAAPLLSDDDLWHIACMVTELNGGSLFNVVQRDCVTSIRASFMDPDAGRALPAKVRP